MKELEDQVSTTEEEFLILSGQVDTDDLIFVSYLQVRQLRLLLAADQQQRAEFIEQSSKNSEMLLSLRHDLNDSLAAVTRHPVLSVLESETQRLEHSLREEELKISLNQSQ